MIIEFSKGKIIVTPHELTVRVDGEHHIALQAISDAVTLMGKGANVVIANDSSCKWTLKLDNEQQLKEISDVLGCAIID
ncbi:DUF3389 domain-containing protein [Vibrio sp. ZSDE26]|uniref:DUF3389 domain-containing protein n=1 Tax=Vibrio amylolyticus TaxID=2847292 RepID=A0A9X1XIU4_9VIBR|nr:DUF3389 domain-containing protein [Vibrio amylolyticus]MCK6263581.1 DUF3389 domain-containing protein [Vibrio amylolyticus]